MGCCGQSKEPQPRSTQPPAAAPKAERAAAGSAPAPPRRSEAAAGAPAGAAGDELPPEELQAAGGQGGARALQERDRARIALLADEDTEGVSVQRLEFGAAELWDVVHTITALYSDVAQGGCMGALRSLGPVALGSHSDLLELLLRVGHTAHQKATQTEPAPARYDDERTLERLLFTRQPRAPAAGGEQGSPGSPSGDLVLRDECVIAALRWLLSDPAIPRGRQGGDEEAVWYPARDVKLDGGGVELEAAGVEGPAAKAAAARQVLDAVQHSNRVDLSYYVKQGLRTAAHLLTRRLLDEAKQEEIRRDQELRRKSWWQELGQKRHARSSIAPQGDAFHQWRRKSISQNVALLPEQVHTPQPGEKPVYTVVLDLDETLIYTRGQHAHLSARPGVPQFLRRLREIGCDVVVWTASTKDYSAAILANIDPELQFVSECVYRHPKWYPEAGARGHPRKDLTLLGRNMDYTIIVDNSIDCIVGQSETNAILVEDFRGVEVDETLPSLVEFFEALVESQMTVPDYLRECGHYHFRPEWQRPAALEGEVVQCFVLDPRPSFTIAGTTIRLWPEPEATITPSAAERRADA
eukprot:TRINITY_DN23428_c0_g1_i1.p1 TRINITY_DN23428_c0_g1~~TRINITY_DN23428_c0_g1_i1.p1  ORF type:complete len:609 (+),score=192.60 TRINITY_DN23428_c0_g1_i1:82-1827(+)